MARLFRDIPQRLPSMLLPTAITLFARISFKDQYPDEPVRRANGSATPGDRHGQAANICRPRREIDGTWRATLKGTRSHHRAEIRALLSDRARQCACFARSKHPLQGRDRRRIPPCAMWLASPRRSDQVDLLFSDAFPNERLEPPDMMSSFEQAAARRVMNMSTRRYGPAPRGDHADLQLPTGRAVRSAMSARRSIDRGVTATRRYVWRLGLRPSMKCSQECRFDPKNPMVNSRRTRHRP